jgi:hypothetical protein
MHTAGEFPAENVIVLHQGTCPMTAEVTEGMVGTTPDMTADPGMLNPAGEATMAPPGTDPARQLRPTRWYQWFILYPAFAMALLTAVPNWMTKVQEVYLGLSGTNNSLAEAKRLDALIRKNATCLDSPRQWVTTEVLQVDGTICPSGDLMIWVAKGTQEFVDFFETDRLLARKTQDTVGAMFSMKAMAAGAEPLVPLPQPDPLLLRVQEPFAITICQSFPDDRTLVRHLKVGEQCYDEKIDTYTGAVVSRDPVPCRTGC